MTDTNDRLHEQQAEYYASMIDSWLQENTGDVDAACKMCIRDRLEMVEDGTFAEISNQYFGYDVCTLGK